MPGKSIQVKQTRSLLRKRLLCYKAYSRAPCQGNLLHYLKHSPFRIQVLILYAYNSFQKCSSFWTFSNKYRNGVFSFRTRMPDVLIFLLKRAIRLLHPTQSDLRPIAVKSHQQPYKARGNSCIQTHRLHYWTIWKFLYVLHHGRLMD